MDRLTSSKRKAGHSSVPCWLTAGCSTVLIVAPLKMDSMIIVHGHYGVERSGRWWWDLGFDIIEISSATVGVSVEDKCRIGKAVIDLEMKPKPEVNANTPGDRSLVSAAKMIREAEAVIEAGVWKVMIKEGGIFSVGIIMWLINSFGVDVNLFRGDEWLRYIAAFRTGPSSLGWTLSATERSQHRAYFFTPITFSR